jgi:hypothetical protein
VSETAFDAGRCRVKPLQPETDGAAIDDLVHRSADYTLMLTGEPPNRDGGADFFAAIPSGKTIDDMLKLGVSTMPASSSDCWTSRATTRRPAPGISASSSSTPQHPVRRSEQPWWAA